MRCGTTQVTLSGEDPGWQVTIDGHLRNRLRAPRDHAHPANRTAGEPARGSPDHLVRRAGTSPTRVGPNLRRPLSPNTARLIQRLFWWTPVKMPVCRSVVGGRVSWTTCLSVALALYTVRLWRAHDGGARDLGRDHDSAEAATDDGTRTPRMGRQLHGPGAGPLGHRQAAAGFRPAR